jgi:hypothetical protein
MERQLVLPTQGEVFQYARRVDLKKDQKDWVRERDDWACQFPLAHICFGMLQVHHILAQYYARAFLGLSEELVNDPKNLITLCENIHVGVNPKRLDPNTIHSDFAQARRDYAVDKRAFEDVSDRHRELTKLGLKYWFSNNDQLLFKIASERTHLMRIRSGREYPSRRK